MPSWHPRAGEHDEVDRAEVLVESDSGIRPHKIGWMMLLMHVLLYESTSESLR